MRAGDRLVAWYFRFGMITLIVLSCDQYNAEHELKQASTSRSRKAMYQVDTGAPKVVNQYDSNGKQHGFWINKLPSLRQHCYYWHGVLHGSFLTYEVNPERLLAVGWYVDGKESGKWLEFRADGTLYLMDDYSFIDSLLFDRGLDAGDRDTSTVIFRTVFYHNGAKHSEGFILEMKDPDNESFFWLKGKWTFYREDGTRLKDDFYSPSTNGAVIPEWP